jgi:hypothetical protein
VTAPSGSGRREQWRTAQPYEATPHPALAAARPNASPTPSGRPRNAVRLRHHPGVVPVYDVAIEDDEPWIAGQDM